MQPTCSMPRGMPHGRADAGPGTLAPPTKGVSTPGARRARVERRGAHARFDPRSQRAVSGGPRPGPTRATARLPRPSRYGRQMADGPTVCLRGVVPSDLPVHFEQQRDPESVRMAAVAPREPAAFDSHWEEVLPDPTVVARTIV